MSDETSMGRPARHERAAKRSEGGFVGDLLTKGNGNLVVVEGTVECGCGGRVRVSFRGPEDSLGARVARGRLSQPVCDACMERDSEREREEGEARERVEKLRHRLAISGVPERWRLLTFERLERDLPERVELQAEAMAAARSWAASGGGLLLHGEVGRGKTVIAAAAAVARVACSAVRWVSVAELLMDLRMPFGAPEYVRAQRWLDSSTGAALVLDDLDKLRPSEHALQPLYVAINGWTEARQPLLVTCNRSLDDLGEWMGETFGEAIASRLTGYCRVIEIGGEDWRLV